MRTARTVLRHSGFYCPRCGTRNPETAAVCAQCGKPLFGNVRARTVRIDWTVLGNPAVVWAILAGLIIIGYLYLAQMMGWKILGQATHYFGLVGALVAAIPAAYLVAQKLKGQNNLGARYA
jgi:uncharacterized membrane protein